MDKKIKQIIKSAIDLHFHIGPEIIPRKYNDIQKLIKNQKGKIAGMALKNHFYPTSLFINQFSDFNDFTLIGSIVLNNFVGGFNPEAVYAASIISKSPIIVWFPTIDADNFLSKSKFEIPWEWVKKKDFQARRSKTIKGISVFDKKRQLTKESISVLKMIKKTSSILATGHISWQESKKLVETALAIGVKKIIITHPIYQRINMPIKTQKYLASLGCFIETCYSMYSIDKISIKKITNQIREIGEDKMIITSDVGQNFSENPNLALEKFARLLIGERIGINQLKKMLIDNPNQIINCS